MARKANAALLDAGDPFPALELILTDGRRLTLPADLAEPYNVVLVNRGAWCPFCVAQLRAFQSGLAKLAQARIGVVSLSADLRAQAVAVVAEHQLEFPVAYGASVDTVAEALGVYYDPHPAHTTPHLQSAGFVLGPGGTVLLAVHKLGRDRAARVAGRSRLRQVRPLALLITGTRAMTTNFVGWLSTLARTHARSLAAVAVREGLDAHRSDRRHAGGLLDAARAAASARALAR